MNTYLNDFQENSKELNEIKKTRQVMKEKFNKDKEILEIKSSISQKKYS
jgi:hypothetical protein